MERDPGQEMRNLWQFVNGLERRLNRRHVMNLVLIGVAWFSTIAASIIAYDKIEQRLTDQQEALGACQEASAANAINATEMQKIVAAAMHPPIVGDSWHEGWRVVEWYDDLNVVRVRPDDGRMSLAAGQPSIESGAHDEYVRLEPSFYDGIKYWGRVNWKEFAPFVLQMAKNAAEAPATSLEKLDEYDGATILRSYDDKRVVELLVFFEYLNDYSVGTVHLDDATYAIVKDMKTLDVVKLKKAQESTGNAK